MTTKSKYQHENDENSPVLFLALRLITSKMTIFIRNYLSHLLIRQPARSTNERRQRHNVLCRCTKYTPTALYVASNSVSLSIDSGYPIRSTIAYACTTDGRLYSRLDSSFEYYYYLFISFYYYIVHVVQIYKRKKANKKTKSILPNTTYY